MKKIILIVTSIILIFTNVSSQENAGSPAISDGMKIRHPEECTVDNLEDWYILICHPGPALPSINVICKPCEPCDIGTDRQMNHASKDAYNLAKSTLSYPAPGVVISNDNYEAIKTSKDYEVASTSGCGPCGGGSAASESFPTLKLSRIHRLRNPERHSSHGECHYSNFDIYLKLSDEGIMMYDPSRNTPLRFTLKDGQYQDEFYNSIKSFKLFNAQGQEVLYQEASRFPKKVSMCQVEMSDKKGCPIF